MTLSLQSLSTNIAIHLHSASCDEPLATSPLEGGVSIGTLMDENSIIPNEFCAICTEALTDPANDGNSNVEALVNCGHQFHQSCICSFYTQPNGISNHCPICRANVDSTDKQETITRYNTFLLERQIDSYGLPRSFLYIIAKNSGVQNHGNLALTFIVGHRPPRRKYRVQNDPYPYQRWGVPGGHQEPGDTSPFHTAVREFLEETKGARKESNMTVEHAIAIFKAIGKVSENVISTIGGWYTAHVVKVSSAEAFERMFLMPQDMPMSQKLKLHLSDETTGYTWLSANNATIQRTVATPVQRSYRYVTSSFNNPNPSLNPFQIQLRIRTGSFTEDTIQEIYRAYRNIQL